MTVGNLIIIIGIILYIICSVYSIKDIIKNGINFNMSNITVSWICFNIGIFIVIIASFLHFYWNYKLF